jgi:transposase
LETPNLAKVGVMAAPRKYPDEVRERAVRMVFEIREETGQQQGAIARVADRLGVNRETLRNWVRQAEVNGGKRPGTTTVDAQRVAELEREVRELRRANEILKAASAFFARELDPRLPK